MISPVTSLKEASLCMSVCISIIMAVTHMWNGILIKSETWKQTKEKKAWKMCNKNGMRKKSEMSTESNS